MTDEITLDRQTVETLIMAARKVHYPSFPDEETRHEIGMAMNVAEGQLEDY